MPSAKFEAAYKEISNLKAKPTQDEQLKVYALAKIAKGEEVKPGGTFDFGGKAKYNAYKKLKDDGVTAEQADSQYVAAVEEYKTKYGVN